MNKTQGVFFVLSLICLVGCAVLKEDVKLIWGSSTKALEDARVESLKETFSCPLEKCFAAVIACSKVKNQPLPEDRNNARPASTPSVPVDKKADDQKSFEVFLQDSRRKIIVIMGVPGSVNTTEVGIFFTSVDPEKTRLEITSLSTSAKVKAADILFEQLGKEFKVIHD